MAKANITGKPDKGVTSLSLARRGTNSHAMDASWSVPNDLVKDSSHTRATAIQVDWDIAVTNQKNDPSKAKNYSNEKTTKAAIDLNNFSITSGSKTTSYNRTSFYPFTDKKLTKVTVTVTPYNSKGMSSKPQSASQSFVAPAVPAIDYPSFSSVGGVVSSTIYRNDGVLYQEVYDVVYVQTITNTAAGTETSTVGTFTGASQAVSYTYSSYAALSYTDYVRVKWDAYQRGYAGDSAYATPAEYIISYPAQATITNYTVSSKDSAGQLTVYLSTNQTWAHPVDITTLEYLANVTYATAESIPSGADWTDAGVEDNGNCPAFTISVSGLIPDEGKHTWIRVKTARADASSLVRYSPFVELASLFTPARTASDDAIKIINATSGDDGESIVALLGWNADGHDDSTGTELSWSDDKNAWKSTEAPSIYNFTWSDGRYPKTGTIQYNDSAEIHIKGLEEAKTYNIRARRYLDNGESTEYGNYCNIVTSIPHKSPDAVYPSCARYVPNGNPLDIRWTLTGATVQMAWKIETATMTLAEGQGGMGYAQISAERLKDAAVDNEVTFYVKASTDGASFVPSAARKVSIVDNPTLSLNVPATMTSQSSFSITATSNKQCNLDITITSHGGSSDTPLGVRKQIDGDTLYSERTYPLWSSLNGSYTATISLPKDLDFWDLAQYEVRAIAIDRETNLTSPIVTGTFSVDWTNKAKSPVGLAYSASADTTVDDTKAYYQYDSSQDTYNLVTPTGNENPHSSGWYEQTEANYVTLTVKDEMDGGYHRQAVQIDLTPPTGSQSTDVYDIYRLDVDKATLIGRSYPLTYTVTDEYAPFGTDMELYYRVALRTVDGDVQFADIPYTAQNKSMRFDWADGVLELPYGVSFGDSYSKSFELRQHMDGSTDGYWNPNIDRKSSLSSSVIKLIQPNEIFKARQLGRYAGAVFVRLPDGSAYEANVQVTDLSKKNDAVTYIAIDAEEIGTTEEFMLPISQTLGT